MLDTQLPFLVPSKHCIMTIAEFAVHKNYGVNRSQLVAIN